MGSLAEEAEAFLEICTVLVSTETFGAAPERLSDVKNSRWQHCFLFMIKYNDEI